METIWYILLGWFILGIVALILISFRKDKANVIEDIQDSLMKHGTPYGLFSLIILYIALPFSILYSIAYFFKRK